MRGRKPKPTALKVIQGTARNDRRRSEPTPIPGTPEKPENLSPDAAAHWDYLARILADLGLLSADIGMALAALCECHAALAAARKDIVKFGAVVDGKRTGAARQLDACERQYRAWLIEFGLTPSSRNRVSVIPKPKESRWDSIS